MFDIQENLKKLPDCPGVYMHKDRLGQVIYVGKAISLKNRVRQYFQSAAKSNPKVRALVSHIAEFEYITCSTEMEALILECNLIKKYMPKYNVLLRDDKTYPYIKVTVNEDYPRILKTRIIAKDGSRYFGPYSDTGAVNNIVELLGNIYALKQCSMVNFPAGHRPCLNYHINRCKGICTGQVSKDSYGDAIGKAIEFLDGKDRPLIRSLEEKMKAASEKLDFEEAAAYRDYIASIKAISEVQRVTLTSEKDMDIILPVKDMNNSFVVLFPVRGGKLSGRETFQIQSGEEDSRSEMTAQFIKQYYSQWAIAPKEILLEELPEEAELIEEFISRGDYHVRLIAPKKGDKKALLTLAQNDTKELLKTLSVKAESNRERQQAIRKAVAGVIARACGKAEGEGATARASGKAEGEDATARASGKAEGGAEAWGGSEAAAASDGFSGEGTFDHAYRVESYDISNTNGVDSVGAMVVFEDMKPIRKDYRRFKIRTIEGPDDYGSLQEMLYRRFKRAAAGDPGFIKLPDVIFMDGGLGQVTAAQKVLRAMKLDVPVVGMAKDDHHRTRAIVFDTGEEILLKDYPLLFKYAGTIQEEVHRFAIDYHRKLHNKNTIGSALDNVNGIGPAKRNALLAHFESIEAIKKADVAQLMEVPGITETLANNIKEFFS